MSLKCKYIVVSYNNTYNSKSSSSKNKITLEDIEKILNKKGSVMTFEKSHQFFNAGKTSLDDDKELIFISISESAAKTTPLAANISIKTIKTNFFISKL